jgi:hypothetical protein
VIDAPASSVPGPIRPTAAAAPPAAAARKSRNVRHSNTYFYFTNSFDMLQILSHAFSIIMNVHDCVPIHAFTTFPTVHPFLCDTTCFPWTTTRPNPIALRVFCDHGCGQRMLQSIIHISGATTRPIPIPVVDIPFCAGCFTTAISPSPLRLDRTCCFVYVPNEIPILP